ncbi:MAG TPA: tail fiber domain-containing protein [Chthoniobacterales bacterium]|nr:tail fiber domain-containing protein [Chthoniobacterales bacterium]
MSARAEGRFCSRDNLPRIGTNRTGSNNTANGFDALYNNTTGNANTANGAAALLSNTTGSDNTANGASALASNTTGNGNTANGFFALFFNTTGFQNTANGYQALFNNTTGGNNTADGFDALYSNTTGFNNSAHGLQALKYTTTGNSNTANGEEALYSNTTGSNNTADGLQALNNNTTGSSNIALGFNAGFNLTTGSNNIDIGNTGAAGDSKKIRIGTRLTHTNTYIAGISGVTVAGGVGIIIDTNGHLGTVVSSKRFKDEIKSMDKASEVILALKPVTFRYKHELDPEGIPQFGLIAEQVEKVNPDLVARDAQGKVFTVRYEAVNAMLLNEFLKEHHKVQELETIVAQQRQESEAQREEIKGLTAGLKEHAAQIQKVSAQLELSKHAPQIVVSGQ